MVRPFHHVTNKLSYDQNIVNSDSGSCPTHDEYFGSSNEGGSGPTSLVCCGPCARVGGKPSDNPSCGIGRRYYGDDFANATAIRRALENAGVELIEENGGGLGARLKERLEPKDENGGGPGVRLKRRSPKGS